MPEMSHLDKYKFRRDLEEIEKATGRGTELVTVYVPPGKQISDVANYLRGEYSQSSNIKSQSTRKHVQGAIESILQRLKYYRQAPPNGIVFFTGHKATEADQTAMVAYVLEPPEPVASFLYRCDSAFFTGPLHEMLVEKDTYGLVVIDQGEATLGLLRGKRIETLKNVQSLVPRKHRMGGQSARRFERLHEQAIHEFFKKIGDLMTEAFLERELRGILVGGPGYTKEQFANGEYLHHELGKKLLTPYFDVGYTDENGLREIVEAARGVLKDLDLMREKDLVQRLMTEIRKPDGGQATYGEPQVRHALELGAVEMLLVSEGLRKSRAKITCGNCGYTNEATINRDASAGACPQCGQDKLAVIESTDVVEELTARAIPMGTRVELISRDSEEGQLLLNAFGGLAAILRYRVT
ncbi:MAG TPA: peptide chain release factor aRF-1 [Thermoplasmata archaeon]|nr:peptide chain release factor aRF-1 [Thermoplasmata archaeon]